MLGGFIWGGAMEGGAIFFLREWRPRDGRSKGLLDSLASPLLSRSRPAMPDRIERGSPKSSSNSSAFMSILFAFCGAARFVIVVSCALYGGVAAARRTGGLRVAARAVCPLEAFAARSRRALPPFYSTTPD